MKDSDLWKTKKQEQQELVVREVTQQELLATNFLVELREVGFPKLIEIRRWSFQTQGLTTISLSSKTHKVLKKDKRIECLLRLNLGFQEESLWLLDDDSSFGEVGFAVRTEKRNPTSGALEISETLEVYNLLVSEL